MTPSAVQGRCLDSLVAAEVRHAGAYCMPGCPAPPLRRGGRRLPQQAATAALRDRAAGRAAVPRTTDAVGAAAPGRRGRERRGAQPVPGRGALVGGGGGGTLAGTLRRAGG